MGLSQNWSRWRQIKQISQIGSPRSQAPGAGAEQSFLCPGKLMIKDGGMIQCDHLLLTKKGK